MNYTNFATGLQTVKYFRSVRVNPGFLVGLHYSPNDDLKHADGADLQLSITFYNLNYLTFLLTDRNSCWRILSNVDFISSGQNAAKHRMNRIKRFYTSTSQC